MVRWSQVPVCSGGLISREEVRPVAAACGLEAGCRTENRSRTTSCFSAMRRISKYYVMLQFNLHSSALNLHCEGLFAHWYFQFITQLLQNVSLKVADPVNVRKGRENPTRQGREPLYEMTGRLHLPSPWCHSLCPSFLCPALSSNFIFFSYSVLPLLSLALVFLHLQVLLHLLVLFMPPFFI